jgi:RNA polymerase sigma-70 factor, ECF subfamily
MCGMNDETARLVQEASVGTVVALDELLARFLPELRAFVRLQAGPRILGKESDDDIVQSVCRDVLGDMSSFDYRGVKSFKKWLYISAQNKIYDKGKFYARQKRDVSREQQLDTNPQDYSGYQHLLSPSRVAIASEEVQRLEDAFDELPADYARVISLAKIIGLNHAEIAEEMGRSETASRVLLHRALARLGTKLTE